MHQCAEVSDLPTGAPVRKRSVLQVSAGHTFCIRSHEACMKPVWSDGGLRFPGKYRLVGLFPFGYPAVAKIVRAPFL